MRVSEMAKILMLILLSSFIWGCAVLYWPSTDVILLQNQRTYPVRTPAEQIAVFEKKPDTTFVQVALVDYHSESFDLEPFYFSETDEAVIKALKKKASEMGGDAIVVRWLLEFEDYSRGAQAVVIRFTP